MTSRFCASSLNVFCLAPQDFSPYCQVPPFRCGARWIQTEARHLFPYPLPDCNFCYGPLREDHSRDFLVIRRWTLIVPSGWALPFWVPLIYAGAHAVGQREHHWVKTEVRPVAPHHQYFEVPPLSAPTSRSFGDIITSPRDQMEQRSQHSRPETLAVPSRISDRHAVAEPLLSHVSVQLRCDSHKLYTF